MMPHDKRLHSIILHISPSPDGHVHNLEMKKILLLLGKLQFFQISLSFICVDGETSLSNYHYEYFKKFIEPNITSILKGDLKIDDFIILKFPEIPSNSYMVTKLQEHD